jgi:hypothetical protein
MIPVEKMIALWETDNDMLITRLLILNIDKQPVAASNIPASAGACDQGWMDGGLMNTPLGLFTFLSVSYGYKNRQVAIASVREFGKVEGQDWVADLLTRMGVENESA